MSTGQTTQDIARAKQEERERLVKKAETELGLASEHPDDAIHLSASLADLVESLRGGKAGWTSERVTQAYIRAACAAHRKTNCLTEILFDQALADARQKDAERQRTGRADGAFWGVPSSFKDTYNIVGVDSSLGASMFCNDPTVDLYDEATLVRLFRRAGGIPFCKTNVPQTLLAFECANPIFGTTSNPFDSTRTGTPTGWGSDIGGSLRIPAAYSGCCGLKPSYGRWPAKGNRKTVRGFDGIHAVVGPMARTVDDLQYMSRAALKLVSAAKGQDELEDDYIMPLRWREIDVKRLRVGYWIESGTIKIFVALTSAEGYKQLRACLGSDPMEPSMQLVTLGSRIPALVHRLLCWVARYVIRDRVGAELLECSRPKSVDEVWQWTDRRDQYAAAFDKSAWKIGKYDVLLCPVQAVPALEHGKTRLLSPLATATILFNVLDLTAGVLPATRVDAARDGVPTDYLAASAGSPTFEGRAYGAKAYDAERMHGLPVGVQVVGRQWDDERVLAAMRIVEGLVAYK
ncbi:hypothetical protein Q5752_006088 [Cryptotrichosporon argae]